MSLWQTQIWQEFLKSSGQTEDFFMLKETFVEKRKIAFGQCGLFVIGVDPAKLTLQYEKSLIRLCKKERCLFSQIETLSYPESERNTPWKPIDSRKNDRRYHRSWYYKKFIPPFTTLIDLQKSQEEILAEMKQKGRYNIRLAEKKWVKIYKKDNTQKNREIFYTLMQETTQRDNFSGNTLEYYTKLLERVPNTKLYFAQHEVDILAGAICIGAGDVCYYYYGASSNNKRNLMSPYLLQWTAITDAKNENYKYYDFLGIANDDDKHSSLRWVTDFKMKLAPNKMQVSSAYLFIASAWKYYFVILLKKGKNIFQNFL